ncbi:MAG: sigma-70 family RNA polymerase sigma factor [Planctomycetes bacterium]|nr:sigma-70 family RNA polymerase sigma factor [Planctomycetota bacterium]
MDLASKDGTSKFGESELLACSRAGDTAAFGRLVELYADRVVTVCARMVRDRGVAEDLAQEAFVKAWQSLASFDGRSAFYTWLYRIAMNLCLSERRRPRRVVNMADEGLANRRESGEALPGDAAELKEEHARVLTALAELDEEHRAVVVLRDVQGLDYEEIAGILGVPRGTVKSRLHRGRMELRERLRVQGAEGPRGHV